MEWIDDESKFLPDASPESASLSVHFLSAFCISGSDLDTKDTKVRKSQFQSCGTQKSRRNLEIKPIM